MARRRNSLARLNSGMMAMALLVGLCAHGFAAADPTVENIEGAGWINWEKQIVKAIGHGAIPGDAEDQAQAQIMARQAAGADAYRNLALVTKCVRIHGDTCVKDLIAKSDDTRAEVEVFVHGAQVVSERQLSDRSFEVIVQVPLVGRDGLLSLLSGEIFGGSGQSSQGREGGFTGLLVDARGLDVKPAVSPGILDRNGNQVYGPEECSRDDAAAIGVVGYCGGSPQTERVGSHPLVVKALGRSPKSATDIIIPHADAVRVREADARSGFLARCGVVVLLGPINREAPGN